MTDYYLPRLGGIELQVRDLSRRQVADGHLVEVVTATRAGSRRTASESAGPVRVRRLGVGPMLGGTYSPLTLRQVANAVRDSKADVVHAHVSSITLATWWGIRAAVHAGIPVVVTAHSMLGDFAPLMRALDAVWRWRSWPVTYTAVSTVAADGVRSLLAPDSTVGVVPNGIAQERWAPAASETGETALESELAAETAGVPAEVVVLAVMRLSRRKRGRQLIKAVLAARSAVGSRVRIRLVIAGDGPQRRFLERQIRRSGLAGEVHLLGRVTRAQVRELLTSADIFAAPAVLESFGIAALEARMAGVPVVARAQSGVRDFVRHGRDGLLVDDDEAFAEALAELAVDRALCASLAARSRLEPPTFSWEVTLAAVAGAYQAATAAAGRQFADSQDRQDSRRGRRGTRQW